MPVRLGLLHALTGTTGLPRPPSCDRAKIDLTARRVRYTPSLSGGCLLIIVRVKHARSTSLANDWALGVSASERSRFAWLWLSPAHTAGVRFASIFFGAVGVVFGGLLALFRHQDVRAKQALARGEDIIARWRVEAENWQQFVIPKLPLRYT